MRKCKTLSSVTGSHSFTFRKMVAGGGEDCCKEDGLQDDACVSGV